MKKLETQLLADFYLRLAALAWGREQSDIAVEYIRIANELMRK